MEQSVNCVPTRLHEITIRIDDKIETLYIGPVYIVSSDTGLKSNNNLLVPKSKNKSCKYCHRLFMNTGDLTRHIRTHTGEKLFKCTYPDCEYAFITKGTLQKHLARHLEQISRRPHGCELCGKSFAQSYDRNRHMLRHKVKIDPNFVGFACTLCPKKFSRRDELRTHEFYHIGYKPFSCDICSKTFSDHSNYAKHQKHHAISTSVNRNEFACNFCKQIFNNRKIITRHIGSCQMRSLFTKKTE